MYAFIYISTFSMLLEPTNYPFYTLSLHHLPRHFFSLLEVNMRLSFNFGAPLFFLFFLVSFSMISARPLTSEQGKNIKLGEVSGDDFVLELEGAGSLKLLGMEDCNVGEEECLQRRMALEVHIDYIYTQHHKP